MSATDPSRNGSQDLSPAASAVSEMPVMDPLSNGAGQKVEPETAPVTQFATRAGAKATEGMSKAKLALAGGGLLAAVLFFIFTAVVEKSPKHVGAANHTTKQSKPELSALAKGSVTPVMETVRNSAPDNTSGQLGPGDIRRTRSLNDPSLTKPSAAKFPTASTLGNVPSFADTQQKWEDPAPYGANSNPEPAQTQQNSLKEPSLVFVRSQVQNQAGGTPRAEPNGDDPPRLDLTPGTRIQAKLETQISSAVQAPVVAVVEYTYAIGDKIIVPAGARVYGQLQQADRSGLVSVKFDEIELLDGAHEKIDAVGTDLNLGPIKGNVYGKNTGKNFLARAASGLGSVLAEVAGNNTSAAFSEDDMLRERLSENIGTAGDSEVMSLNANTRVVVSVPADTKIYIVFTKHEQTPAELHKVPTGTQ
jgi:type IV secretory pathway VirB10-like protein